MSKPLHEDVLPFCDGTGTHAVVRFPSEHADESMNMLMREDDAEMLELGVENTSEPPTPHIGPDPSIIVASPPSLDIGESAIAVAIDFKEQVGSQSGLQSEHETCTEDTPSGHLHLALSTPSDHHCPGSGSTSTTTDISRITERIEVGLLNHSSHRHQLDGPSEDIDTEISFNSVCDKVELADSEKIQRHLEESIVDMHISPVRASPVSVSNQLCKIYHRRLHEAAQFAEAVGEPQDGMIQVIIDDDDDDESDDDDSDDNEPDYPPADGETDDADVDVDDVDEGAEHDVQNEGEDQVHKEASASALETREADGHDRNELNLSHNSNCAQKDTSVTGPLSPLPRYVEECTSKKQDCDASYNAIGFQFNNVEESFLEIEESCLSPPNRSDNRSTGRFPSERSVSEGNLTQLDKHDKEQAVIEYPLRTRSTSYQYFRHKLPLEENELDNESKVFKGIVSPEVVTKRGIARGNYAQLHRKAWLEVSDKHHRYGKNLRTYYKHWEKLGHLTNMFFDWLDVKGEAAGWKLPNLPECPREQLDNDRVTYITDPQEQCRYLLKIVPQEKSTHEGARAPCKIVDLEGNPVRTGSNGWIFVLRDHELYGSEKRTKTKGENGTKLRFHHSSFFGGKAVAAAGIIITDDNGYLTRLYPHSGHYRPGEADMQRMLYHVYHCGVDLSSFLVDMQQIMHVSREVRDARTPKGHGEGAPGVCPKKAKKTDSLYLKDATFVALFLAHKARSIGLGLFKMIHRIRPIKRIDPCSVTIILDAVDHGGFWKHHIKLKKNERQLQYLGLR
jgi:hypothetical protein